MRMELMPTRRERSCGRLNKRSRKIFTRVTGGFSSPIINITKTKIQKKII